jgi:cell division septum initiation protein DivIVA
MTLITPDERTSRTEELLQSLLRSVSDLRQELEDLTQRVQAGEDADMQYGTRQVQAVDGLVRACQKVEASLVEQQNKAAGIAQRGYALDLERARSEIGCRLARLRRCCGEGGISE